MEQTEHLSLYPKFYQLIKYLDARVHNFPKRYKYTLGKDIIDLSWKCIDLLIRANNSFGQERHMQILELSLTFDFLKVRLRMAQEIKVLFFKQYVHIYSYFLKEIGTMIGGWLKWSKNNISKSKEKCYSEKKEKDKEKEVKELKEKKKEIEKEKIKEKIKENENKENGKLF